MSISTFYGRLSEAATEIINDTEGARLSSSPDDVNALFVTANVGSLFEDVRTDSPLPTMNNKKIYAISV